jgi:hypothetical protein
MVATSGEGSLGSLHVWLENFLYDLILPFNLSQLKLEKLVTLTLLNLKQGIILFWALYMSLVVILNIFDALKTLKLLPQTWKFSSGNFWFIEQVTKMYSTPSWINGVLFAGAIIWEIVNTVMLWAALATFDGSSYVSINSALIVGLALWAAFMVIDEFFLAWSVAIGNSNAMEGHRSLFVSWLVCLMAINLLPNI